MKINTKTVVKKMLGLGLLMGLSVSLLFSETVDARLIFTTEGDGLNADEYHIDYDDSAVSEVKLFFGGPVSDSFLSYDKISETFYFSKALDLNGQQLINFVVENADTAPTCDEDNIGRMYYNTLDYDEGPPEDHPEGGQLLFCTLDVDGPPDTYEWVANRDNSITAAMLNPDTAGLGLIQSGDGSLQVNVETGDDATLMIEDDMVKIREVRSEHIEDDTITIDDIGTDAVGADEIVDGSITLDDLQVRSITDILNPEFQNLTLWTDPAEEHVGTMEADYDTTNDRNYYKWWTTKGKGLENEQSYYLILQYTIPDNFIEWEATDQIELDMMTDDGATSHNKVNIYLSDIGQDAVTLTGATNLTSGGIWDTKTISFDPNQMLIDWAAGEDITLKIKMTSKATWVGDVVTPHPVWIGKIKMYYKVK